MDIVNTGKGYLKQGRGYLNQKMHNTMIQHSVFAAIVFLIVAHPKTFQLVDSVVKVQDKNVLLLIHAVVAGLIMYFGSLYLFEPVQRVLLGGGEGRREGIHQRDEGFAVDDCRVTQSCWSDNLSKFLSNIL